MKKAEIEIQYLFAVKLSTEHEIVCISFSVRCWCWCLCYVFIIVSLAVYIQIMFKMMRANRFEGVQGVKTSRWLALLYGFILLRIASRYVAFFFSSSASPQFALVYFSCEKGNQKKKRNNQQKPEMRFIIVNAECCFNLDGGNWHTHTHRKGQNKQDRSNKFTFVLKAHKKKNIKYLKIK